MHYTFAAVAIALGTCAMAIDRRWLVMACTRHFLNLEWEHHHWRKLVTLAETLPKQETNMWGRVVDGEFVHCVKHDVCEVCGKTREDISCLCDCAVGERCPIRLEWMNTTHQMTG